jgi:glycosyltransferase involved in cell wall biosynthesis
MHVADYGNRAAGSFIPSIVAVANELHERGDRCSLISKNVTGAVWHETARQALDAFATAENHREVFEMVWREAPDVIHVHFTGWALPATLAGYVRGARVIWHLHSAMRPQDRRLAALARAAKYRWFGAGVHRFVTVSNFLREGMIALGVPESRIMLIRNGVNTSHFRPPLAAERRQARHVLGVRSNDRVLLYFGRDTAIKGGDILWKALDGMRGVVLLAVGLPAEAIGEFSSRVRTINLPFAADPRSLYWAADTLAMPSRLEGAPYTLLEALCTGLPIVASDITPLAEIALDDRTIRLVSNDPASFAAALRAQVVVGPAETATARARFGLARWVQEVTSLYAA